MNSHLARIVQPVASLARASFTSGVNPTALVMPCTKWLSTNADPRPRDTRIHSFLPLVGLVLMFSAQALANQLQQLESWFQRQFSGWKAQ